MKRAIPTDPTSSSTATTLGRLLAFVVAPALLAAALFWPPLSLGNRLLSRGAPLVTAEKGGEVLGPFGAVLQVGPGAVEKKARISLQALDVRSDGVVTPQSWASEDVTAQLAKVKDGSVEQRAIGALPAYLTLYAPVFRGTVKGDIPSQSSILVPLPYEITAPERADLWGWNGWSWQWLSSTHTSDGLSLKAELPWFPQLIAVAEVQPRTPQVNLAVTGEEDASKLGNAVSSEVCLNVACLVLGEANTLVGSLPAAARMDKGQAPVLTISNVVDGVVRSDLVDNMLIDPQARAAHVADIVARATYDDWAGVALDYRGVASDLRAEFTLFVSDLADRLHSANRTLAVRVDTPVRQGDDWVTGGYDWAALGSVSDHLRIPALVWPGAYAGAGDMDRMLLYATDVVDRRKIDLALTTYSHDVVADTVKPITYQEALRHLASAVRPETPAAMLLPGETLRFGAERPDLLSVTKDEDAQVYWFRYADETGTLHTVWLENGISAARKLQYVSKFSLGGVSLEDVAVAQNDQSIAMIVSAFEQEPIGPEPEFAYVWTVKDQQGQTVNQQVVPLAKPDFAWTAANTPGNYTIVGAMSDDGGRSVDTQVAQLSLQVPTPTPLPTPTNTPTPVPTNTPAPTATPKPTAAPTAAAASAPAVVAPAPRTGGSFGYGIQVDMLSDGDHARIMNHIQALGFGWVKQQVEWFRFNPAPGQYDWGGLDRIVDSANAAGINVLFSVVKAPQWARPPGDMEQGPPADPNTYGTFMRELAARYRGRVRAYEIWNEQNLYYEWGGHGGKLNAAKYVELLKVAYAAVKAADPNATVISGALTPTGWNDGDTAIDDRLYLEQMYQAGLKNYCDAVGAHPSGYNNPPDADWRTWADASAPDYKGHPASFFRGTMEGYRNIMIKYGDSAKRIWATEFGWATVENLGVAPVPGYGYAGQNSEAEQAEWLVRAMQMGKSWGWVGPMFVWNLNFAPVAGNADEKAAFGIVRGDWSRRPAFDALANMPK